MRFEFIDENKIKIKITKSDLEERELKITELAYGSDKAREFFQEVMELAYEELGFDVNNIPIVVEAVPISLEEINVFVTKLVSPDDLEQTLEHLPEKRMQKQNIELDFLREKLEEAKDNIFNDLSNRKAIRLDPNGRDKARENKADIAKSQDTEKSPKDKAYITIFSFDSIDTAVFATKRIPKDITFKSSLVLNNERFYLTIETKKMNHNEFIKIEDRLFEYGEKHISTIESKQLLAEHGEIIIKKDAINVLYKLQ